MTSARVPTGEERKEIEEGPQPIKPLNPAFDITSSSQAQFITSVHPDTQAVDEAFHGQLLLTRASHKKKDERIEVSGGCDTIKLLKQRS
ncbi:hypothetical protein Tco_0368056 [Tanacetum coccineum]